MKRINNRFVDDYDNDNEDNSNDYGKREIFVYKNKKGKSIELIRSSSFTFQ